MPWNRISMSNDEMLAGKADKLQSEFAKIWMVLGAPPEAAMYASRAPGGKHDYFFTPGAVEIAAPVLKSFGAAECEKPGEKETLIVLVKNEGTRAGG